MWQQIHNNKKNGEIFFDCYRRKDLGIISIVSVFSNLWQVDMLKDNHKKRGFVVYNLEERKKVVLFPFGLKALSSKIAEKCVYIMLWIKCKFPVLLCSVSFKIPPPNFGIKNWWPLPLCTTPSAAHCELWLTASQSLMAMDSRLPESLVAGKGSVKKPIILMLILPGKIAPTLLISIISGST